MSYTQPLPGFIGGYNRERSPQIDNQRTINMYVVNDPQSPEGQSFAQLPGLRYIRQVDTTNTPTRPNGLFGFLGRLYIVNGSYFYQDANRLGPVSTTTSAISWSSLASKLIFTDFAELYVFDPGTGTYTSVTPAFINNPGRITTIAGRVVVPKRQSNVWYFSDVNAPDTYEQNNFFLFQQKPDFIEAAASINSHLILFGQIHTEFWLPQAVSGLPFYLDNNLTIDYGTWSAASVVTAYSDAKTEFVAWLARDSLGSSSFLLTQGTEARTISTPAIEILLQNFRGLDRCYGYAKRIDGHLQIEWNFPVDNRTLVFDTATNLWFEREMLDESYFIGNSHTFLDGIHYIGSRVDGALYEMRGTYVNYYSSGNQEEPVHKTRFTGILRPKNYVGFECNYLEIKMETGFSGSGEVPNIRLSVSKDGDAFSGERIAQMAKIGEYGWRVYWYGLGFANSSMLFKIESYSPVRFFMFGASASIRPGKR